MSPSISGFQLELHVRIPKGSFTHLRSQANFRPTTQSLVLVPDIRVIPDISEVPPHPQVVSGGTHAEVLVLRRLGICQHSAAQVLICDCKHCLISTRPVFSSIKWETAESKEWWDWWQSTERRFSAHKELVFISHTDAHSHCPGTCGKRRIWGINQMFRLHNGWPNIPQNHGSPKRMELCWA